MKFTVLLRLAAFFILTTAHIAVFGQCKSFTKKNCIPALAPFIHNGQMNSTLLLAGEKAELQMIFYSGQDYRLMVCAQPILGDVSFRMLDKNKREVFNSREQDFAQYWDFKVVSTQQFFIEVDVPSSSAKTQLIENGCVSVLVGFKQ